MSLLKSSATVGSLTLISRVFGFVRDMMIAFLLGAGPMTDAFFVAFKLPNFMRRLFAEGAFNAAFLPMFAGKLKTEGEEEALRFASETYSYLSAILVILCGLAILFMPWLMWVLAPGFSDDPAKFDLTVTLTRITFPYLLLISLVCLMSGILNSFDRFAGVAATPILLNLSLIGALWLLPPLLPSPAHALSVGVVIAGVAQFLWLAWFCRKIGMMPALRKPRLTPDLRRLLRLIGPAALGAGVAQINLMIDVILASTMENAVSYLYYADRVYELPLAVIGIAVATALLPALSRHIRAGEEDEARRYIGQSVMLVLLFGLPSAAGLLVLADPVVRVLFEHGAFGEAERLATAPALVAFAAGLPAFLLVKIFVSAFFAAQDTKTPVRIAMLCVLINFIGNVILMQYFAHVGLAASTSLAGWVNALLLGRALHKQGRFVFDKSLGRFTGKVMLCSLLMTAALFFLLPLCAPWLASGLIYKAPALALLIGAGVAAYFTAVFATRAVSPARLKGWLRRKR